MLRSDMTAAIARAVGTALALVLPAAVVAMLRLYSIVQGGAVDERELREAVVEFLQEDAG